MYKEINNQYTTVGNVMFKVAYNYTIDEWTTI